MKAGRLLDPSFERKIPHNWISNQLGCVREERRSENLYMRSAQKLWQESVRAPDKTTGNIRGQRSCALVPLRLTSDCRINIFQKREDPEQSFTICARFFFCASRRTHTSIIQAFGWWTFFLTNQKRNAFISSLLFIHHGWISLLWNGFSRRNAPISSILDYRSCKLLWIFFFFASSSFLQTPALVAPPPLFSRSRTLSQRGVGPVWPYPILKPVVVVAAAVIWFIYFFHDIGMLLSSSLSSWSRAPDPFSVTVDYITSNSSSRIFFSEIFSGGGDVVTTLSWCHLSVGFL